MHSNKWNELPQINTARGWAGSVLLSEKQVFCFGGANFPSNILDSIETLNLVQDGEWREMALDFKLSPTYQAAGAEFKNRIALFGGSLNACSPMFIMSKEG